VRQTIRDLFSHLEGKYPYLKENLLAAMGNVETGRLLDLRFLDPEGKENRMKPAPFPIVTES
jgi:hypothetical protein